MEQFLLTPSGKHELRREVSAAVLPSAARRRQVSHDRKGRPAGPKTTTSANA